MADLGKKETMTLSEKFAAIDKIAANINKKIGSQVVGRIAQNEEILDRLTIKFVKTPSSILNETFGGFPKRRCSIIAGLPDSGKMFCHSI